MASDGSDEFRLVSPTISNEGRLPRHYNRRGTRSEEEHIPTSGMVQPAAGTKTLALVGLPEGFSGKEGEMGGDYAGIKEREHDLKVPGWYGPRLPTHGHRLQFKLYALDDELHLGDEEKLLDSIEGHVLEKRALWLILMMHGNGSCII
ncbi:Phosphatidylethanolamine-binding protein [Sesbania bispinosa]|nr:Phosphatidylethanolamine-binding protein [Sesbania bispinosa]